MAEENVNGEQNVNVNGGDPGGQGENIVLSKQDYISLMTKLAVMEDRLEQSVKPVEKEDQPDPVPYADKTIDQLSNAELLDLMQRQVNDKVVQPLLNTILQLSVKEEIRDLGEKYEDFKKSDETRKAVIKIAENNSNLSLEQAYLIHVGKNPKVEVKAEDKKPTPPPSNRTEVSTTAVNQTSKMGIKEAAEAAFKSLKYTGDSN